MRRGKVLVVDGKIGAGKTTLVNALRKLFPNVTYVTEPLDDFSRFVTGTGDIINPLEFFYENPKQNAIATQLYFLDVYSERLRELEETDVAPLIIADRWITSCDVFTNALTLEGHITQFGREYFAKKYKKLSNELVYFFPDVVYILDTPTDVCLERQRQRGRKIENDYMQMETYLRHIQWGYDAMAIHQALFKVKKSKYNTLDSCVQEVSEIIKELM